MHNLKCQKQITMTKEEYLELCTYKEGYDKRFPGNQWGPPFTEETRNNISEMIDSGEFGNGFLFEYSENEPHILLVDVVIKKDKPEKENKYKYTFIIRRNDGQEREARVKFQREDSEQFKAAHGLDLEGEVIKYLGSEILLTISDWEKEE